MKTFLFPGQGSQARGMGADLFDSLPEYVASADAILGYSIKELCLEDPRSELDQTSYTQPALFVVNSLAYLQEIRAGAAPPDYLAGHSLGEFNALFAAGCFDFETGLRIVRQRAHLMSQATGGAMAAILNATREEIEAILRDNDLATIDLANYNTPAQIVISGPRADIGRAEPFFRRGRIRFHPLNTSGAFHSRYMRAARDEFRSFLATVTLQPPRIPVIANVTARPYRDEQIAETLANQIASTVRWSESVEYLLAAAAEHAAGEMQFQEVGHGSVLTRMLTAIKRDALAAPGKVPTRPAPVKMPAAEKVTAWNRSHPVGTRVRWGSDAREVLETRTAAMVLFGHRAAVYLAGYNGYFDLDELVPLASG